MEEIAGPGQYIEKAGTHWVRYQGLEFWETFRQPYGANNCVFAAGHVEGTEEPEDTVYIWIEKDGIEPTVLFMRPDEMAALIMVCSTALWSHTYNQLDKQPVNP